MTHRRQLKARKGTPEHKYLPKIITHSMGPPSIQPACTCGWVGQVNFRPSAKIAWKEHARGDGSP